MTQLPKKYYYDIYLMYMVKNRIKLNNTLLQQCNINLRDHHGRNALYWAIYYSSEFNVRKLLQYNIDLYVEPRLHALFHAVALGNRIIVGNILAQDVNINMRNAQGQTPLMVAILNKNSAMVHYLMRYGADATVVCYQNKSVYDYARISQTLEIQNIFAKQAV